MPAGISNGLVCALTRRPFRAALLQTRTRAGPLRMAARWSCTRRARVSLAPGLGCCGGSPASAVESLPRRCCGRRLAARAVLQLLACLTHAPAHLLQPPRHAPRAGCDPHGHGAAPLEQHGLLQGAARLLRPLHPGGLGWDGLAWRDVEGAGMSEPVACQPAKLTPVSGLHPPKSHTCILWPPPCCRRRCSPKRSRA